MASEVSSNRELAETAAPTQKTPEFWVCYQYTYPFYQLGITAVLVVQSLWCNCQYFSLPTTQGYPRIFSWKKKNLYLWVLVLCFSSDIGHYFHSDCEMWPRYIFLENRYKYKKSLCLNEVVLFMGKGLLFLLPFKYGLIHRFWSFYQSSELCEHKPLTFVSFLVPCQALPWWNVLVKGWHGCFFLELRGRERVKALVGSA